MRSSVRVLSFGALACLFLALPTAGLAGPPKDPLREPGGGPQVTIPGGPTVIVAGVPGATVGAIGRGDALASNATPGATVIGANGSGGLLYFYDSSGHGITASLRLPASATLWQVDVYGYATDVESENWLLLDEDVSAGTSSAVTNLFTLNGPGIIHGTYSAAGGITLASGHEWSLLVTPTYSTVGYVGAVFQYTLPTLSLVPMTPVRVFDSRFSSKIVQGAPRTTNVKDAINIVTGAVTTPNAIPQGARAISFTLTVTTTGNPGYVAVLPGTTTTVTASTINWTGPGATLAAGGIVSLGTGAAERQVTLVVGGAGSASTDVIVDITGYFQ